MVLPLCRVITPYRLITYATHVFYPHRALWFICERALFNIYKTNFKSLLISCFLVVLFTGDEDLGCCVYLLMFISYLLVIVTFPFSLFTCLKVSILKENYVIILFYFFVICLFVFDKHFFFWGDIVIFVKYSTLFCDMKWLFKEPSPIFSTFFQFFGSCVITRKLIFFS